MKRLLIIAVALSFLSCSSIEELLTPYPLTEEQKATVDNARLKRKAERRIDCKQYDWNTCKQWEN